MPVWQAAAALQQRRCASVAPEASPSRMPRSSSGGLPIRSRRRRWPGSAETCADDAMVERARVGGVEHRAPRSPSEAVEHDRHPPDAAPPGSRRRSRRIRARRGGAAARTDRLRRRGGARRRRRRPRACAASAAPATPVPGPIHSAALAAEQRQAQRRRDRRVGDPHLADRQQRRSPARRPSCRRRWRARIPPRSSPARRRCRAVGVSRFIS